MAVDRSSLRILACSLDTPGLLFPLIGIGQALASRGHTVAFVTNFQWHSFLEELGFERLPLGEKDGPSFHITTWGQPSAAAVQVPHVESALETFRPDVLLAQPLTLGPLIVAERHQLPICVVGFSTYLWPLTGSAGEGAGLEAEKRSRIDGMLAIFNELRSMCELPAWNRAENPFLGDLFLMRNVRELDPDAHLLPDKVRFVGSCLWEDEDVADPELDRWLDSTGGTESPLIYVQAGRSFQLPGFWPSLVEALTDLGTRVVSSTARMDVEAGDGLPETFFCRAHVPQERVLPHSRLAVSSGNSTAFLGALTHGVPSLLIPGGGEQPDVAALGRRIGVARSVFPTQVSAAGIRGEIEKLLHDESYTRHAATCADAFARVDSFELAADLIEELHRRSVGPAARGSTP